MQIFYPRTDGSATQVLAFIGGVAGMGVAETGIRALRVSLFPFGGWIPVWLFVPVGFIGGLGATLFLLRLVRPGIALREDRIVAFRGSGSFLPRTLFGARPVRVDLVGEDFHRGGSCWRVVAHAPRDGIHASRAIVKDVAEDEATALAEAIALFYDCPLRRPDEEGDATVELQPSELGRSFVERAASDPSCLGPPPDPFRPAAIDVSRDEAGVSLSWQISAKRWFLGIAAFVALLIPGMVGLLGDALQACSALVMLAATVVLVPALAARWRLRLDESHATLTIYFFFRWLRLSQERVERGEVREVRRRGARVVLRTRRGERLEAVVPHDDAEVAAWLAATIRRWLIGRSGMGRPHAIGGTTITSSNE